MRSIVSCLLVSFVAVPVIYGLSSVSEEQQRRQAAAAQKSGNFKDAYDGYRRLLLESAPDAETYTDLREAVNCLNRLGRISEVDALIEAAVERHSSHWELLREAGSTYSRISQSGVIISGEFKRGPHRGGRAKYVVSTARDRIRTIQLLLQSIEAAKGKATNPQRSKLFELLATQLLTREAWELQSLTNLEELPDYSDGRYRGRWRPSAGAPVDEDGNAVFYEIPKSWEDAQSDGERWRWCLTQMAELDAGQRGKATLRYAEFLVSQFGVQTLGNQFSIRGGGRGMSENGSKDGPWNVDTLKENETIARLATGPKRFELRADRNYIKLFETVAKSDSEDAQRAIGSLTGVFMNRQQYPRAAALLRTAVAKFGATEAYTSQLNQIVGKWARFENAQVQAAGKGASVDLRFRNATKVSFEAKAIDYEKLLNDIRKYLQSSPQRIDFQKINVSNIGYRLIQNNEKQYIGRQVARWDMELDAPQNHFDDVVTVATPLQTAGAYLLTAKVPGGNTSRIVVWLTDAAIVSKKLNEQTMYFVADARTGSPVANAQIDVLGYKQTRIERRRYKVETLSSRARTNDDGLAFVAKTQMPQEYSWLTTAKTPKGGLAAIGFQRVWYGRSRTFQYNKNKVYLVTDRPVYRPGQKVSYKFWVRNARFDGEGRSFAQAKFEMTLRDGRGQEVVKKNVVADEFGTIAGEFELKDDATLGRYYVSLKGGGASGGGTFKVEEYKKPEYEVTVDAPKRPIMLGDKAKVTVRAKYYFGSPVTNATVKYKVTRTAINQRWYPMGPWDWLYGRGYGWFAVERDWYPGSRLWCCVGPHPWWFGARQDPPEVVLDREVKIGADGTVQFELDTAIAKLLHDDQDHRYNVTAEVVDRSRRTIVGSGSVIVARKPFDVAVWANRGHYKAGDKIDVSVRAGTLDGVTVKGAARVRLMKIKFNEKGEANETEVATADVELDDLGRATHRFNAAQTGQYRVAVDVTDQEDREVSGGHMLVVLGGNENGSEFRFNDLELIADKREYKPGDKAELMLNTSQLDSTVLLFVRPENSVYPKPLVVRMKGKSTIQNIDIEKRDMPNFFVEAMTVANGRVHSQMKSLYVPPEKRIANIEVKPSKKDYLPGDKAELELKLTDLDGKPFRSPTVVSVYDKSVEYISGGSAIPDVREFFWKIRRNHYMQLTSNLGTVSRNVTKRGEKTLQLLGIFGGQINRSRRAVGVADGVADKGGFIGGGRVSRLAASDSPVTETASAKTKSVPGAGAASVEPTVRANFADTAYWSAAVLPDANGIAKVSFDLPDDLTTWKVRTWSIGKDTRVGEAQSEFVTRKNVIIRMQAPRFFTERDEVVLSANVHNYLDAATTVRVELQLDGEELVATDSLSHTVEVPADGEVRVDWTVKVAKPGNAVARMRALSDRESDAVERQFPVLVHGMLKTEAWTGSIAATGDAASFDVTVPGERRPEQTELVIRYSPTLAGAMVDALPYLIDGPHDTTDGKLYRFVPGLIVQRILQRTGVDLADVERKRANLNAQQLGDPKDRAKQWKHYKRNPVFSAAEMQAIVKENLNAVVEMQLTDGGWGWFSGWGERSTPHMTASMVHGLQIAKQNDLAIPDGVIERGVVWLKRYEAEQIKRIQNWGKKNDRPKKRYASNMDAFVFMVLTDADASNAKMREFLYRDRAELAACSKAMFGIALHKLADQQKLAMVLQNLSQFIKRDAENQTAYLELPGQGWWYWWGNDIEANAWYLKLLSKADAKGQLAPALARYILNNRRHGTWWRSIRDTAIAVESLGDFVTASGEFNPDVELDVLVDGKVLKQVTINRENLFSYEDRVMLQGEKVASGRHTVEIRKRGKGPLYYSAYLTNFTKEDAISATGLEIKVLREFYKLIPEDRKDLVSGSRGQALEQKGQKYRRERIVNFAEVRSGDLIEVELNVESKNDYDYIVFEDPKPSGFEAVDRTSGYNGNELGAYVEVRDNRVVLYVRSLARGKHSVSYRVRAEVPGQFSAMPTRAYGMYAPELKANSDESQIRIADRKE